MSSQLRERTRKLSKVLTHHHRRPHSTKSHDTLRFIREDDNEVTVQQQQQQQPQASPSSAILLSNNNNNSSSRNVYTPHILDDSAVRNSTSASYAETTKFKGLTERRKRRLTHRSSHTSSEDCIIS